MGDVVYEPEAWAFKVGKGPIFEEVESQRESEQQVFDDGFRNGFDKGYAEAVTIYNATKAPKLDQKVIKAYEKKFVKWVGTQKHSDQGFLTCEADVRMEYPFPEEPSFYALYADHNCSPYVLTLSVVLSKKALKQMVGFYGAVVGPNGCQRTETFTNAVICEFELKSRAGFGMLFVGSFTPVFYLTEWEQQESWASTFNWW